MDFMAAIAPAVASIWTIGLVMIALLVWACRSAYQLLMQSDILLNELDRATGHLKNTRTASAFAARYETLARDLSENPVLGAVWREYQRSLFVTHDGLVRATERCDLWFDLGLFRCKAVDIDLRYHAALPGLLVGAGLLFTFFGLAVGLHGAGDLAADNVTQAERNAALHQLLGAASFKFWTSVAGLALSIGYALFRKQRLHKVETALDAFRAALDERIPPISPIQLLVETNDLLRTQAVALRDLADTLAKRQTVSPGVQDLAS
jgi:hypothetical protein